MRPLNQRQGFLVSALIHLTLLMILVSHPPTFRLAPESQPETFEKKDLVFLPPPAQLRQMIPLLPAPPRPQVAPVPSPAPPPPPKGKDRISIGPPTNLRTKGPMILRREDDLTQVPRGQPTLPPAPASPPSADPSPGAALAQKGDGGAPEVPGRPGLRLPPGLLGEASPRGEEGQKGRPGPLGPSIQGAIADATRRLERDAQSGKPTGTGQNLGPLFFDPQGADFTVWLNTFKNEVYRNWILPQTALFGYRGHVDFEFTVERDGTMSAIKMVKSSGTSSLDRAARNALTGSRFQPLPDDYVPPRLSLQANFLYNEAPQGS